MSMPTGNYRAGLALSIDRASNGRRSRVAYIENQTHGSKACCDKVIAG